MIVKNKSYTLAELHNSDDEQARQVIKSLEFATIKNTQRHPIVTTFNEFSDSAKQYLLELKEQVFNNNTIYVHGSRIKGTYLTDEEYEFYKQKYGNIKKSDWDISSKTHPNTVEFKGYKIDYNNGTFGVEVK